MRRRLGAERGGGEGEEGEEGGQRPGLPTQRGARRSVPAFQGARSERNDRRLGFYANFGATRCGSGRAKQHLLRRERKGTD
jgi:hypothetical protein